MLRVLVVDDYPETANVIAEVLERYGHTVRKAGTGLQALAETLSFSPQVTLLDLDLPDLSGYEVARRMREQPGGASRRIVALTGWANERSRALAMKAGCDHFILKSTRPGKLQELLQSIAVEVE